MCSTLLVSASYDQEIRFLDIGAWRNVMSIKVGDFPVNCMHFLCDERYLAIGGCSFIRVFDLDESALGVDSGSGASASDKSAGTVVARYEASGVVNVSSLGSFCFRKEFGSFEDCSVGALSLDESLADLTGTMSVGYNSGIFNSLNCVLYATGEDGAIRFFDCRFASHQLVILKTLRTGASVTCSALSPDFRFLLTGSQIGQVSVWHLPSIMGRCFMDNRSKGSPHASSAVNAVNLHGPQTAFPTAFKDGVNPIVVPQTVNRTAQDLPTNETHNSGGENNALGSQDKKGKVEGSINGDVVEVSPEDDFLGNNPLQIISFQSDYSAVRSLAISPVGWWSVAAMHCGNLHFIGISQFTSGNPNEVNGRRSEYTDPSNAEGNSVGEERKSGSLLHTEEDGNINGSGIQVETNEGKAQSCQESNLNSSSPASSQIRPGRHLPASELSGDPHSSKAVDAPVEKPQSEPQGTVNVDEQDSSEALRKLPNGADAKPSASDAASRAELKLLQGLEGQKSGQGTGTKDAVAHESVASGFWRPQLNSSIQVGATKVGEKEKKIQFELEMKVIHSFVAHHKCILKVVIAPNNSMLVTCSADYSVGRFVVPKILQTWRMSSLQKNKGEDGEGNQGNRYPLGLSCGQFSISSTSEHSQLNGLNPALADKTTIENIFAGEDPAPTTVNQDPKGNRNDLCVTSSNKISSESSPNSQQVPETSISSSSGAGAPSENTTVAAGEVTLTEPAAQNANCGNENNGEKSKTVLLPPSSDAQRSEVEPEMKEQLPDGQTRQSSSPAADGKQESGDLSSLINFSAVTRFEAHSRWVWDAVFSECSSYLFTASSDACIRVWNCASDSEKSSPYSKVVAQHKKPVTALLLYTDKRKNK